MQALTHMSRLRWLVIAAALGAHSLAFAEPAELDITIELMQPDETPAGFINRIELPSAAELNEASIRVEQEHTLDAVTIDVEELTKEVQQTINTTITDAISAGDAAKLPDAVTDILADDIATDLPDDIIDELVDDLLDNPVNTDTVIDELGKAGVSESEFHIEGGAMVPESLEGLLQEVPSDELDPLINEMPLPPLEPIQEDDMGLPDTGVLNTL